jgi:hypothetical protein
MEYKITEKYTKEIIDEILKVKKEKGLLAETLLEHAKDKNSKLHNLFEWDNNLAAKKWRLQQARIIVNEIKVIVENKEYYAFENISLQVGEDVKREYYSRDEILTTPLLKESMVRKAYNTLLYWKEQYHNYVLFEPVIKAIESIESDVKQHDQIYSSDEQGNKQLI